MLSVCLCVFFYYCSGDHRVLPVLTHSFPTRRSSDLAASTTLRSASAWTRPPPATTWSRWHSCSTPPSTTSTRSTPAPPTPFPAPCCAPRASCSTRCSTPTTASTNCCATCARWPTRRSEEHTYELQSLMRLSYAVF